MPRRGICTAGSARCRRPGGPTNRSASPTTSWSQVTDAEPWTTRSLPGGDTARVAEVTRLRALLRSTLDDPAGAIEVADRALRLAEGVDERELSSRCLRAAASVRGWAGRPTDAVPLWQRSVALAVRPQELAESHTMLASCLRQLHRYDEARALGVLGTIRMERGDVDAAIELCRRSFERCTRIGCRRGEQVDPINLANALHDRGEPQAALEASDRAAEIANSLGDQLALALVRLNPAVIRYQALGHDEVARRDPSRDPGR